MDQNSDLTLLDLEDIMLSKTVQSQKDNYGLIPLVEGPRRGQFMETEGTVEVAMAGEGE
jgi:hypothetical protein